MISSAELLRELEALDALDGGAVLGTACDPDEPVRCVCGEGTPQRALFCTKWGTVQRALLEEGVIPAGLMVFSWGCPLSVKQVKNIRDTLAPRGLRLEYVGELSPRLLTIYLSLRVGGVGEGATEFDVDYLGIEDEWLAACVAHSKMTSAKNDPMQQGGHAPIGDHCRKVTGYNWLNVEIEALEAEMRMLALLEATGFEWESVIGANSLAMLRSGWTLHLEGATHPAFYDDAMAPWLRERLFGMK